MGSVFQKLNLTSQREIVVFNVPESFEPELARLESVNRDTGWHVIRDAGFDSVRQVAIDADWSALRFRRVEYIKG